jgi:putative tryptophan/tyrosine transport system substrate-binding protein
MRRRKCISLIGGAIAWPLAARAQQSERMPRVGVLIPLTASDPEAKPRAAAFMQGLGELGWIDGKNVHIEYRWSGGEADSIRKNIAELVALAPDVVLANGSSVVAPLLQATRTTPIVFVNVVDPISAGFVASLAQPGGNVTGFSLFEYGISGKWLGLLKQIAPPLMRAAILRDTGLASGSGQLGAIQSVASSLGVEVSPIDVRDPSEIERGVTAFARKPNGGLIVPAGGLAIVHRDLIIALAARHKLPAVYPFNYYVTSGGLMSYGPDQVDQFRRAASYIDRILKGEKAADLPVQAPTKYDLAINLKTAKALGLTVPLELLARADQVIE